MSDFRKDLMTVLNGASQENGSNTPDWILADYLSNCLLAFDTAVNARERWHGRKEGWSGIGWRAPVQPPVMDWKPPTQEEMQAATIVAR